jgi:hypothetical protein
MRTVASINRRKHRPTDTRWWSGQHAESGAVVLVVKGMMVVMCVDSSGGGGDSGDG